MFILNGGIVSQNSSKQVTTDDSIIEAEYIGLINGPNKYSIDIM